MIDLDGLVAKISQWFADRKLTDAVVGYSGGIDSTVTALLLARAGIATHLVVVEVPNQRYSSPLGGIEGAMTLVNDFDLEGVFLERPALPCDEDVANEAALPILRVACFYGAAASLRAMGKAPVVVGTVNMSEAAFLGFWGKASDAAQDFYPISHLTKTQVYEAALALGVPKETTNAIPSGDLLYRETNDRKMIGASYEVIDKIIACSELYFNPRSYFEVIDDFDLFRENITNNSFKYQLPFPGFHLSSRLEDFRQKSCQRLNMDLDHYASQVQR